MADTLGLIISPCDASEKLYRFYQAAQRRDKDIADLRLQLIGLKRRPSWSGSPWNEKDYERKINTRSNKLCRDAKTKSGGYRRA
jgi:hypothetical protein